MRLTRAGEYAMRCALFLSFQGLNVIVSKKEIARAMEIPDPFLGKIAQQLALAGTKTNEEQSPFHDLSERELQVMMMVLDGRKTNDISDSLCLSPKTVSTYRHRLFTKLQIQTDVELTRLAISHGMIQKSDN